MALATESSGRLPSVEPSPVAWSASDDDRARAFAQARRHSVLVRSLRVILPICALAVLSSYGLTLQRSFTVGNGKVEIGPVAFTTDVLTMHNPRYEGYGKDGSRYVVAAKTAEQDIGRKGPIRLNAIEGNLVQANKTETALTAARGVFDSDKNELELLESIEIKSSDGMAARLTRAQVHLKDGKIVSDEPVNVSMPSGTLQGRSMVLLQRAREATFSGGVTARLNPGSKPRPADQQSAARLIGASDGPVDVSAPKLTIYDERKTAVFSGGVRVEQSGSVMTARTLEVSYDGEPGADSPALPGSGGGRVNRILAQDEVVLTRGSDRVTSAAAEFNPVTETAALTGGVVFRSGADRQAIADRADLDFKAETTVLSGDVVVSQGENTLKGRRLFVDQKNAIMQLSAPATNIGAAGRIAAEFRQSRPAPSRSQAAPDGESNGWRFRTDPNAPIEIEADVLDVDDKVKTATFRGDVRVVQGEFTIRTVELVATYTGQATASLTEPAGQTAKPAGAQLTRVQARRKVVVTSKDDQSATGDWAEFDVKANTVVIGGDVTLTQGRNVVRGPRLVIDMTTGLSRMETGKPAAAQTAGSAPAPTDQAAGAPGKKGWPAGACGGRMCAVFYPEDIRALAQRNKAKAASPGKKEKESSEPAREREGEASSSWTSTTIPASRK